MKITRICARPSLDSQVSLTIQLEEGEGIIDVLTKFEDTEVISRIAKLEYSIALLNGEMELLEKNLENDRSAVRNI